MADDLSPGALRALGKLSFTEPRTIADLKVRKELLAAGLIQHEHYGKAGVQWLTDKGLLLLHGGAAPGLKRAVSLHKASVAHTPDRSRP